MTINVMCIYQARMTVSKLFKKQEQEAGNNGNKTTN